MSARISASRSGRASRKTERMVARGAQTISLSRYAVLCGQRGHEPQRFREHADHARGKEAVDGLHVRRAAADGVAEWCAIVIVQWQALQMSKEMHAQVAQRLLRYVPG